MQLAIDVAGCIAGRGRPGAPGDGLQAQRGARWPRCATGSTTAWRANGITGAARRRHLRQDQGVRRIRLRREPRDQLRLPGLRLVLAEALPPGGILRGAAQRPADGLLLAAVAGPRRPATRRARCSARTSTPRRPRPPGRPDRELPERPTGRAEPPATPVPGRPQPAVRLGLSSVRTISTELADRIVAEREPDGPYPSMADLARRVGLTADQLEALATAGAFDSLRHQPARRALGGRRGRRQPARPAGPAGPRRAARPGVAADDRAGTADRRPVGHRHHPRLLPHRADPRAGWTASGSSPAAELRELPEPHPGHRRPAWSPTGSGRPPPAASPSSTSRTSSAWST